MSKVVISLLITALSAFAQLQFSSSIEGTLTAMQGRLPANLSIEIHTEGRYLDKTDVNDDGSFGIRNLPAGTYEVRLVDSRGDVLRRDYVTTGPHSHRLDFRIPGIREDRPASGSVSLKELAKHIPRGAKKELQRSDKALQKGDLRQSVAHLLRALEQCADCPQVYNNLGARYLQMGMREDAIDAFRKAVDLDTNSAVTQTNLALALMSARNWTAAEAAAQKALNLDSGSIPARYVMGLVSIERKVCTKQTVEHLRAASMRYARAHLSAASALVCRGETKSAIHELTAYLNQPNPEQRQNVERWLSELQRQSR